MFNKIKNWFKSSNKPTEEIPPIGKTISTKLMDYDNSLTKNISDQMMDIYYQGTGKVTKADIDEAYRAVIEQEYKKLFYN